jgi:agmatinase
VKIRYDRLPFTFLGLDEQEADFDRAKVLLLPVAYDHTSSYGTGSRKAPLRVIEASRYVEFYDEELGVEPRTVGIHTLPIMEPDVSGPEGMVAQVESAVAQILALGKLPFLVGGEHSLSAGAVAAAARAFPGLSVLHLDAHADLREAWQGSRHSHACVAARMAEHGPVLQIGVRALAGDEQGTSRPHPVRTITAGMFHGGHDWRAEIDSFLTEKVYVTVDVDVFDPSVLPATGTPEPDGLTWRAVLAVLRHAFAARQVVGMDVVELEPIPGLTAPDYAVAKLIHRMIGYRYFLGRASA